MKMRVKPVPRQRLNHDNKNIEMSSENTIVKFEESEQYSEIEEDTLDSNEIIIDSKKNETECETLRKEKEETLDYIEEALDMSIRPKAEVLDLEDDSTLSNVTGGLSCCYSDSHLKNGDNSCSDDSNNNVILHKSDPEYSYHAGTSGKEDSNPHDKDSNESIKIKEEVSADAVNLAYCHEGNISSVPMDSNEKLKQTVLYKIMTDPTFVEKIQKHKQSKRYSCQFCKQEFGNSDELAGHMDVKMNDMNQVACCACKKTFAQKRYLRYHQRCHSERAMFTCEICSKRYTRMDNLTRHNAFHLNPDKFSCMCCEKTFARKDLLNKHLKCHENKYRFLCEQCQKYFKGPLSLDHHKKNVHGVV